MRQQPRHRHGDGALAAAGLADDTENFAALEREIHVKRGLNDVSLVVAEGDVETVDFKQQRQKSLFFGLRPRRLGVGERK